MRSQVKLLLGSRGVLNLCSSPAAGSAASFSILHSKSQMHSFSSLHFSPHIFSICFPSFAYFSKPRSSILAPRVPFSLSPCLFYSLSSSCLHWLPSFDKLNIQELKNLTKFTLNKQTSLFYKNNLNMFQGIF